MNTIRIITSGAILAGLSVFGLAATAAPASAQSIKAHGTATRGENNKLHRAIDKQKCLTLRESQKIVGAKGEVERDGVDTYVTFTGKKHTSVQSVSVFLIDNCAFAVLSDLTHGRFQMTGNEENIPSDFDDILE
jgi:hypothetical protein